MVGIDYSDLISPITPVIIQARDSNSFSRLVPFIRENALNNLLTSGQGLYGIAGYLRPKIQLTSRIQSLFSIYNYLEMPRFNMVAALMTGPMLEDLLQSEHVANIYKDRLKYIRQYPIAPADGTYTVDIGAGKTMTFTSTYWTKYIIGGMKAKEKGFLGDGTTATVIDTGGTKFNPMTYNMEKYTAIYGLDEDANGHGEWTASALGGKPAIDYFFSHMLGTTVYMEGMAPNTRLIQIKALGFVIGTGSDSALIRAIEMAINLNSDIVSMSWGGTPSGNTPQDSPFYVPFQTMYDNGMIPVVAAGNSGPGAQTIDEPGDLPQGLTVGAYNVVTNNNDMFGQAGTIAGFSSRGPTVFGTIKPDTVGPGAIIDNAITGVLSGAYTHYRQ